MSRRVGLLLMLRLLALGALSRATIPAAVLKGPFVMLEDAATLSVRIEVDRPDAAIVLRWESESAQREERRLPDFARTPRDTFVGRVIIDLHHGGKFVGYQIEHEGKPFGRYDWRSRIDGTLGGDPRLLVFGDPQGGKEITSRLAARWREETFDLLVGLGDLVDAGSRYESWSEEFFEPLRDVLPHWPLLAVVGNHDPYRERSMTWFDTFFARGDYRRWYAIDFGDLRLIGLNNSDAHTKYGIDSIDPLSPQHGFLAESLLSREALERRHVVFAHVPMFSASTVVNREFGSELQRRYVLPLLERARVLGFFAGHHHKYERVLRPGLRGATQHVVTGGGGGRLFAADRETGGTTMDREVLGVHHYVLVDFRGGGSVIARSIDGKEIDRTAFAAPVMPESTERPALWRAELGDDFALRPVSPAGSSITLSPTALSAFPATANAIRVAELYRTSAGFVAVASPQRDGELTWQGYDPGRGAWGYLQGALFTLDASASHGMPIVVTINGAELAPLDRIFPVRHWPVAGSRAGVTDRSGAVVLLRGAASFDLRPDPSRVLGRWRWGAMPAEAIAVAQAARQLAVLANAAPPRPLEGDAPTALLTLIRGEPPETFLIRSDPSGAVLATLVHWPGWNFVAIAPGDRLTAQLGSILLRVTAGTTITTAVEQGIGGIWIRQRGGDELFVPLGRIPKP